MKRKYLLSIMTALSIVALPVAATAAETADTATAESQTAQAETEAEQSASEAEAAAEETQAQTTSSASATAAEIEGILVISGTSADSSGTATADVIRLGDETVVGGTQEGDGEATGEIFDSGDTELGRLALAAWHAAVEGDSAESRATLVQLTVIDQDTIDAKVLDSYSQADGNGSSSYSEGVRITLGGGELEIILLRSETSSDGEGETYLASVNGEKAFTDEQVEGQLCAVDANPLLYVKAICVEANEETGGVTAGVADVDALDNNAHAELFTASSAPGADDGAVDDGADDGADDAPSDDTEVLGSPGPNDDTLPYTGAPAILGLGGLMALGAGEALRRFRR